LTGRAFSDKWRISTRYFGHVFMPSYYKPAERQLRDHQKRYTMTDYSRYSDQNLQRKTRKKQAASKEVSVSEFRSIPDDKICWLCCRNNVEVDDQLNRIFVNNTLSAEFVSLTMGKDKVQVRLCPICYSLFENLKSAV